MSVREYIGARYVPLFAEPLEWDATKTYEPLTVVLYQGNSFTSRQAVPANIPITNTTYWAQTGNYNAQIEQYRAEVQTFDGRITQNEDDIDTLEDIIPASNFDSTNTVKKYVDDKVDEVEDIIPASNFDSTNTVKKYVDDSISSVEDSIDDINGIIPATDFDSTNTVKSYIDGKFNQAIAKFKQGTYAIIIGNSWVAPSNQLDPGYGDILTTWMNNLCGASIKCFGRGSAGWLTTGQQSGQTIAAAVDEAIAYAATDNRVCTDVFFLEMQNDQSYFTSVNPSNYINIVKTNINKIKNAIPSAKIHYIVDNAFSTTVSQYSNFIDTINQAIPCEPIYTLPFFGENAWRDTAHLADSLIGYGKLAKIIYTEMVGGEQVYPALDLSYNFGAYVNSTNFIMTAKGDPIRSGISLYAQLPLNAASVNSMSGYQIVGHPNTAKFDQTLYMRLANMSAVFAVMSGHTISGKGAFQFRNNWNGDFYVEMTPELKTWLGNPGEAVVLTLASMTTKGWL